MVIGNFNVVAIPLHPAEYNPVLIVDSDRVTARQITFQRFKPLSRREAQILQSRCGIHGIEPEPRCFHNALRNPARYLGIVTVKKVFCAFIGEVEKRYSTYGINSIRATLQRRCSVIQRTSPISLIVILGQPRSEDWLETENDVNLTATRKEIQHMNKSNAIEIIRANQAALKQYHVRAMFLFGSVTRDDVQPGSDVDILVDFEPDARIGLFTFVRMQHLLSRLLGCPVDLVTRDAIHPALKDRILREAIHVI